MDIFLLVLGSICLLIGLIGAVLPLPGPPLSFVGMLLFHYSSYASFSEELLWVIGALTAIITLLDYYIPIWGTKKFGGTKAGSRGSMAGLLVGMFMGPLGIFVGAFLGAFAGEYFFGDRSNSLRAALGSFVGFAAGIAMKVCLCLLMIYYCIAAVL